ncbi:Asp23/Gls24 family envelope stress response protein [Streptomyces sp. MBT49]|uniref:DUF6286 domain-containing Asp23/Gls24 family envelope stress response protein n=1 Tax=Streptomyces sp. MBT49 TaxID=1488380 RepID=UPI00190C5634|nr:DUF6286 domain-containing protein [Streptomyces sp. MBT49]MBK3630207.1 Asp23/Gls24 family envelope stress response protein [Streptomyces sp. MBT49]
MTAAAARGTTTVSPRAVRRIAERAAAETLPRPGGAPGDRSSRTARTARTEGPARPDRTDRTDRTGRPVPAARVAASVRGNSARLALGVTLPYPAPLAETVGNLQRHVAQRTGQLTGLDVADARITVTALAPSLLPHPPLPPSAGAVSGARTPRRRWSGRRVPVTLLTAAAAVGTGALALDLVRVHTAHQAPAAWRTGAVHWLSGHGPGDPAVVVGGALLALAGVWMAVLALTPGRRRRSTLLAPAPRVEAAMDRSAVEALLRDAVGDVEGVTAVRVRASRRRAVVRAPLAFGDRATAHAAVTAAARDALTACRLRRTPRLRIVVTPQPLWHPPTQDTTTPPPVPDTETAPPAPDPGTLRSAPDTVTPSSVPGSSAPGRARAVGGER